MAHRAGIFVRFLAALRLGIRVHAVPRRSLGDPLECRNRSGSLDDQSDGGEDDDTHDGGGRCWNDRLQGPGEPRYDFESRFRHRVPFGGLARSAASLTPTGGSRIPNLLSSSVSRGYSLRDLTSRNLHKIKARAPSVSLVLLIAGSVLLNDMGAPGHSSRLHWRGVRGHESNLLGRLGENRETALIPRIEARASNQVA